MSTEDLLDADGRLLSSSGELFINALEIAATGDRIAWAWHEICRAPFISAIAIQREAIAVIKRLNNQVQDHVINGVTTRTAYICVSEGYSRNRYDKPQSKHIIDKIFQERTDALHEFMRNVQMDLADTIKMSVEIPMRKEEAVCAIARACAKMLDRPYIASCDINTARLPEGTWVSEILSSGVCTVAFKFGVGGYRHAQGCQLV